LRIADRMSVENCSIVLSISEIFSADLAIVKRFSDYNQFFTHWQKKLF